MILLTGDIHGDVRTALWAMQKHEMTKDDTLILLGDVGLNYYGADQGDRKRKKLLNKAGIPVFMETTKTARLISLHIMKQPGTEERFISRTISQICFLQRTERFLIWMVRSAS